VESGSNGASPSRLLQEARSHKSLLHDWIGSEHRLLAILGRADPVLSSLLEQLGILCDRIKEAIVERL
jgi:hypothetical protein